MRSQICALLGAAALCVPIAGCGDDDVGDPIPQAKADRLVTELDAIRDHVDEDLCEEAATAVNQARVTVDTLDDDGVGSDVQDALGDGVDNLGSLVSGQCEEPVETVPETTPETTPTDTTDTTTTDTTTTDTTETTTTDTTTTDTTEPDEDTGGAQFDPNALPPGQSKKLEDGD